MGIFSESYTRMIVVPSFWQRLKFLFCRNVEVIAASGDMHESVEFNFNAKKY